ncbi:MAG: CRTAC1 family protein [Gemmataceae bacterium]|nr:CRTAC1 family protein [Gemmataceae bacterium]
MSVGNQPASQHSLGWPLLVVGTLLVLGLGAVAYWAATRRSGDAAPDPFDPLSTGQQVPDGPPWFRDKTSASGIEFIHVNGQEAGHYAILESLGGGVAMIDYDGDGLLDLFFTGGGTFDGPNIRGRPCKLYKNLGNWQFRDVTAEVGLDKIDFYSHGVAVVDYDRDGRPDLLVTGYGQVALFRNDAGKRFIDVTTKAGLLEKSWSSSAGFADLTGSGFPDLYICNYVDWSFKNHPVCRGKGPQAERDICSPQQFKPLIHALYRNNRDGTFRDVTREQKLRDDGCGLGVVMADFTGDRRPGIYVANDAAFNHFYLVRSGGKLEEKALLAGVAGDETGHYNGSMGVDVADYDGSGRASIFVANFQDELHALYRNLGQEHFAYQSKTAGLGALSRQFVTFGTSFIDVDNDGWEDLIMVSGHVLYKPVGSPVKQVPVIMRNIPFQGRRFFRDYAKRGGPFFSIPDMGRGLAVGDLDNDGWPDVVVCNTNSPAILLRNEAAQGNPARWLGVKLVGKENRDVVGSTLTLKTDTGTLTRFTKGGGSYLSASDQRILFGLGTSAKVGRLSVKWSWSDTEQHFDNLEAGSYWELREGEPAAKRSP